MNHKDLLAQFIFQNINDSVHYSFTELSNEFIGPRAAEFKTKAFRWEDFVNFVNNKIIKDGHDLSKFEIFYDHCPYEYTDAGLLYQYDTYTEEELARNKEENKRLRSEFDKAYYLYLVEYDQCKRNGRRH